MLWQLPCGYDEDKCCNVKAAKACASNCKNTRLLIKAAIHNMNNISTIAHKSWFIEKRISNARRKWPANFIVDPAKRSLLFNCEKPLG